MLAESFGEDWLRLDFPFPCEIHYRAPRRLEQNQNYKVLVLHTEPSPLCSPFESVTQIAHFFDLIIAANPSFKALPNAIIAAFGGCWVTRLPEKKEFSVSFLFSLGVAGSVFMDGYAMRLGILNNRHMIKIPYHMYKGQNVTPDLNVNLPLLADGTKNCLFESMFSLAIENNSEENYFTEKLIDCLATNTVPIYYGCSNIHEYFDIDGFIIVKDHNEALEIINELTPDDYWNRLSAIRNNFLASQKYWEGDGLRIRNIIQICRTKQIHGQPINPS